ncbi:hypothetical protein JW796_00910 [Candidatus Dojkabacteria bacterium]|nr:hypothetical protein [Candidatus Dojkabacteria bacterium]
MKKQKFNMSKKYLAILLIISAFILLLSLITLVPLPFRASYANAQLNNIVAGKSFIKNRNVFFPEVIVFTKEDDGDVTANFVKLKRNFLVWWEVDSISTQEVDNKFEKKSTDTIVASLTDEIEQGKLNSGDNIDADQISDYDMRIKELNDKEYEVIAQYTNEAGDKVLKLKLDGKGGTYLTLNEQFLPISGNISSPAISPTGDEICYSKYQQSSEKEHEVYSGKVYCINIDTKKEEEIYSFGGNVVASIGVNKKYVIYSLSNGEIGVVGLSSRQKTKLLGLQMLPQSDPGRVIFADEQSAIIDPNDYEKLVNNNQRMISIDLLDLTYSEKTNPLSAQ